MSFHKALRQRALRTCAQGAVALVTVLLAACGGGGGSSTTTTNTTVSANAIVGDSIPGANVIAVSVDGGPAGSAYQANRLFTDVTICVPGTATCQTLDHVLVDTGSTGLRVIASAITNTGLQNLTKVTGDTGKTLLNCATFLDGTFAWGPVAYADVKLGSKTAGNLPIQLIADSLVGSTSGYNSSASACSSGSGGITKVTGTSPTDATALGAKGILGIGHLKEDCGAACVLSAFVSTQGYYYECATTSAGSCTSTVASKAPLGKQIKNPVPLFNGDNNGLAVVLPAISPAGAERATTLQGSIVFGVDTQANNSSAGATLLQLNSSGYFTATLNGVTMPASFLDSGSNGIFFDTGLNRCNGFYCPASATTFTGTLKGTNNVSKDVSFDIKTAQFATNYHVFPLLAGPLGKSNAFDGGLPFFFGRKVFVGIEGAASNLGAGAYYGF